MVIHFCFLVFFLLLPTPIIKTNKIMKNLKLNPYFITGFADGESCLYIRIIKNQNVELVFQISLHQKDRALLELIQLFFGVGKILKKGKDSIQYRVGSHKGLAVIIDHFEKYPLISQKQADFKRALELIVRKEHLTMEGFHKIVAIKASMNKGLSDNLKEDFPTIKPVDRPKVEFKGIPEPNWFAGFSEGEGCFMITINEKTYKNPQIIFTFSISQKDHSQGILKDIKKYFGCGVVSSPSKRNKVVEFYVKNFEDILLKIIPHFEAHPLITSKALNFESFKEAVLSGGHLTTEGFNKIKDLKATMNTGRSFEEKFRYCTTKTINFTIEWLIGFIDAEGCFYNRLKLKHKGGYKYIETESTFSIGQSISDISILLSIKQFLGGSGWIKPKLHDYTNYYEVKKINSSCSYSEYRNSKPSTFLPILDKYPLLTRKQLDYLDFKKFLVLKESKAYRNKEGLQEMERIVLGMNRGRDGIAKRKGIKFPD